MKAAIVFLSFLSACSFRPTRYSHYWPPGIEPPRRQSSTESEKPQSSGSQQSSESLQDTVDHPDYLIVDDDTETVSVILNGKTAEMFQNHFAQSEFSTELKISYRAYGAKVVLTMVFGIQADDVDSETVIEIKSLSADWVYLKGYVQDGESQNLYDSIQSEAIDRDGALYKSISVEDISLECLRENQFYSCIWTINND